MSALRPASRLLLGIATLSLTGLLLVACSDDTDPEAEEPSSPTGSPSESPSPSESGSATPTETAEPAPGGTTKLSTRGLAEGVSPGVAYVAAVDPADLEGPWQLVRANGSTLELGPGDVGEFAPMGRGIVTLDDDGEGPVATVLIGLGAEQYPALGYALASTPDGSIVGWLGADAAPQVVEGGGRRTFDLSVVTGSADIGALVGSRTCKEGADGGCTAFVNSPDASESWFTDSHGQVGYLRRIKEVADALDHNRIIGLRSISDDGSCSGYWLDSFRGPAWVTCDYTLISYSPDGSLVLATDPYLDGLGQRTLAFLDENGNLVHEFSSGRRGPVLTQMVWEDDEHALALAIDGTDWSVLRLGVDGTVEYALSPVPGSDTDRPFGLPSD